MNYIIACAGGFGREVFHTLTHSLQEGNDITKEKGIIAGFIDDNPLALGELTKKYPSILGSIRDFEPKKNDLVFIAAGTPQNRRSIAELLQKKNCTFTSVIHPDTRISKNTSIGIGTHIGWSTFVSCDVVIGRFISLNCNITVGHDAVIEDYVEVGPGTAINGYCYIEEGVHIAPNCTISPGVRVGAWSKISANTAVMRDVPPFSYIIGVPGTVHRNFFKHPDKVTVVGVPAKTILENNLSDKKIQIQQ